MSHSVELYPTRHVSMPRYSANTRRVTRAKRWNLARPLGLPFVFQLISRVLNPLSARMCQPSSSGKPITIRLIESMTFLMVFACLFYLISLWQAINPFSTLMEILSIHSTNSGYTVEAINDAPDVQIARLTGKNVYAEIHTPPSV
jgi:hypothetical protein